MNSRTPQANSQVTAELKQMLRETQRKLRLAQSSLTESEHNRERRLKIMRKTHQSAIALKQALIQELQDIVAEKDEYISLLEARLKNGRTPPTSPIKSSQVTKSLILIDCNPQALKILLLALVKEVRSLAFHKDWRLGYWVAQCRIGGPSVCVHLVLAGRQCEEAGRADLAAPQREWVAAVTV